MNVVMTALILIDVHYLSLHRYLQYTGLNWRCDQKRNIKCLDTFHFQIVMSAEWLFRYSSNVKLPTLDLRNR